MSIGWRLHSCVGQPVPVSDWVVRFFHIEVEFSVFLFVLIASCPSLDTTEKDLALYSLQPPSRYLYTLLHVLVYIYLPAKHKITYCCSFNKPPSKEEYSEFW